MWKAFARALGIQLDDNADENQIRAAVNERLGLARDADEDAAAAALAKLGGASADKARNEALAAERQRREGIRARFQPFAQREDIGDVLNDCLDDFGVTVEAAQAKLLTALGQGAEPLGGSVRVRADETEKRRQAKSEALLTRMDLDGLESSDGQTIAFDSANPYRGMTLGELARVSLTEAGVDVTGQGVSEFAPQALARQVQAAGGQTTSDFPILLDDAMHKLLVHFYNAQSTKYRQFCRIGQVSDFRAQQRHAPGMIGGLDRKNEAGEYVSKNLPDNEMQSLQAEEYGNIIRVTRKVLVDDDIGRIQAMIQDIGMAAARGVDRDVFETLASNPTLNDGHALFSTAHGNVASTAAAPSTSTLAAGEDAMAAQKAPGEDQVALDILPASALGGNGTRRTLMNTINSPYDPDASNKLQKPNPVFNLVGNVIGSARITGPEWYLFADPAISPVLEVAFLNGQRTPRLIQDESLSTGALKWRPTLDYAVGAVGYRGGYKNAGA